MAAIALKDFDRWPSGILGADIPANANAQRLDVLSRPVVSTTVTAEPGAPTSGDLYVLPAGRTGTVWATFSVGSLAYYLSGNWYEYTPFEGLSVYSTATNTTWVYDGTWAEKTGESVGLHMVPIVAAGMIPASTAGCSTLTTVAMGSGKPDVNVLYFDAATDEAAHFAIPMPESWDEGTVTFEVLWTHAATTVNFGTAWSIEGLAVSDNESLNQSFGTSVVVTDTGGTTNNYYRSARSSAVTIAGTPAVGDIVYFKITRVTANAGDTLAIDAGLIGIRLYMTTSAGTDA